MVVIGFSHFPLLATIQPPAFTYSSNTDLNFFLPHDLPVFPRYPFVIMSLCVKICKDRFVVKLMVLHHFFDDF